jgi:rhodanese-related sulfurtransferase
VPSRPKVTNHLDRSTALLLSGNEQGQWADACLISISEPGNIAPINCSLWSGVLFVNMDDICDDNPEWTRQGYSVPHPSHAFEIAKFIRANWERTIIVHCHAGISRSAAVCSVLEQLGWEPVSWPTPFVTRNANPLLVRLLKQQFGDLLPNVYPQVQLRSGIDDIDQGA